MGGGLWGEPGTQGHMSSPSALRPQLPDGHKRSSPHPSSPGFSGRLLLRGPSGSPPQSPSVESKHSDAHSPTGLPPLPPTNHLVLRHHYKGTWSWPLSTVPSSPEPQEPGSEPCRTENPLKEPLSPSIASCPPGVTWQDGALRWAENHAHQGKSFQPFLVHGCGSLIQILRKVLFDLTWMRDHSSGHS